MNIWVLSGRMKNYKFTALWRQEESENVFVHLLCNFPDERQTFQVITEQMFWLSKNKKKSLIPFNDKIIIVLSFQKFRIKKQLLQR